MIKDLLDEDLDGHVISFLDETANIARLDTKTRRPIEARLLFLLK